MRTRLWGLADSPPAKEARCQRWYPAGEFSATLTVYTTANTGYSHTGSTRADNGYHSCTVLGPAAL